jgi:hypothetical protein
MRDIEACWPFEKKDYLGFGTLVFVSVSWWESQGFRKQQKIYENSAEQNIV